MYYKSIKVIIKALELAKVIIDAVVCHHGRLDLIIIKRYSLFILHFKLLLYYFLGRLFIASHPQTDSQTKWQNGIIEA